MPCGWEGNHRSGVALAMHHRLVWVIHPQAHGLRNYIHALSVCCLQDSSSMVKKKHWSVLAQHLPYDAWYEKLMLVSCNTVLCDTNFIVTDYSSCSVFSRFLTYWSIYLLTISYVSRQVGCCCKLYLSAVIITLLIIAVSYQRRDRNLLLLFSVTTFENTQQQA